jgi:hypothetical protein
MCNGKKVNWGNLNKHCNFLSDEDEGKDGKQIKFQGRAEERLARFTWGRITEVLGRSGQCHNVPSANWKSVWPLLRPPDKGTAQSNLYSCAPGWSAHYSLSHQVPDLEDGLTSPRGSQHLLLLLTLGSLALSNDPALSQLGLVSFQFLCPTPS